MKHRHNASLLTAAGLAMSNLPLLSPFLGVPPVSRLGRAKAILDPERERRAALKREIAEWNAAIDAKRKTNAAAKTGGAT